MNLNLKGYKFSAALPHIGIGALVGLIPAILAFVVAKHWLDADTSTFIMAVVAVIFSSGSTNATTYGDVKK